MFIAMNRFRVKRGAEDAFEKVWLSRDSYLGNRCPAATPHLPMGAHARLPVRRAASVAPWPRYCQTLAEPPYSTAETQTR